MTDTRDRGAERERFEAVQVAVVVPAFRVAQQLERVVRGIPDWVRHIVVVVDVSSLSPDR